MLETIANTLQQSDNIIISTHVNPDGDAIGSCLALRQMLQEMGKSAWVIAPQATPNGLAFLDPDQHVLGYTPEVCDPIIAGAELLCILDVSEPKRMGVVWEALEKIPMKRIIIDHHPNGTAESDHAYIQPTVSATGILIYRLLEYLKHPLSPEIAQMIYVAIMTDTGGFRFSNTDPETFRIAGALVEAGASPQHLYSETYEKNTMPRFRLFQKVLLTTQFAANNRIAWMICPPSFFEQTGTTNTDLENIVNFARSLECVEVSMMFSEPKAGHVRVSMRSKDHVAVNELAARFGGGGHARAAGATLDNTSLEQAQATIIEATKEMLLKSGISL